MINTVVYSKPDCPWCDKAKALLKEKNMPYTEKVLNEDFTRDDLRLIVGLEKKLTVPQIIIGNYLVGGYNDLVKHFEENENGIS